MNMRCVVYPTPSAARPAAAAARNRYGRRAGRGARRRGLRRPARLPSRRFAAAHRLEGVCARAGPAGEGLRRHGGDLAFVRLGQPAGPRTSKRGCRSCAAGSKMPTRPAAPSDCELPGVEIPPNVGPAHRQRCLTALALFDEQRHDAPTLEHALQQPTAAVAATPRLGHRRAGARRRCRTSPHSAALDRCCSPPAPRRCASPSKCKHWQLPPKWLRMLVAFAALLGVLLDVSHAQRRRSRHRAAGRDGGHEAARDAHGARSHRHRVPLPTSRCSPHSSTTRNLLRLPYMLVTAWLLTVDADAHSSDDARDVGARGRAASPARCSLQALPLAVLLFLFFPRLPGQFWARAGAQRGDDAA